jgi:hypothetical protein
LKMNKKTFVSTRQFWGKLRVAKNDCPDDRFPVGRKKLKLDAFKTFFFQNLGRYSIEVLR